MNGTGTGIDYAVGLAPLTYVSVPPPHQRMDSNQMVYLRRKRIDVIRSPDKVHMHDP